MKELIILIVFSLLMLGCNKYGLDAMKMDNEKSNIEMYQRNIDLCLAELDYYKERIKALGDAESVLKFSLKLKETMIEIDSINACVNRYSIHRDKVKNHFDNNKVRDAIGWHKGAKDYPDIKEYDKLKLLAPYSTDY